MKYIMKYPLPELVYIRWLKTPNTLEAQAFIQTLEDMLNAAPAPLFFISDLRQGRIVDIRIINQLSLLTRHPNWGGSTAFSANPISKLFVKSFQKQVAAVEETNTFYDTPEEAIAFIAHLLPDAAAQIDWEALLADAVP